jgi:hypothetical protein
MDEAKSPVTLSKAQAAKKVVRIIPALDKDGNDTGETKSKSLDADEVFAFAVQGDRVVVVTTDGQKLEGKL